MPGFSVFLPFRAARSLRPPPAGPAPGRRRWQVLRSACVPSGFGLAPRRPRRPATGWEFSPGARSGGCWAPGALESGLVALAVTAAEPVSCSPASLASLGIDLMAMRHPLRSSGFPRLGWGPTGSLALLPRTYLGVIAIVFSAGSNRFDQTQMAPPTIQSAGLSPVDSLRYCP